MLTDLESKIPLITLIGPPNSGKTTLFNLLSGKKIKTVNYPGATIEFTLAKFLDSYNLNAYLLDSPGIVSIIPNSPDERITVKSLYNHPEYGKPDLIVVTIDSSQFSRHLLLAKQIIGAGFKVVIVLTMNDILSDKGLVIDDKKLSELLKCSVVKADARKLDKSINNLIENIKSNIDNFDINEITQIEYEESELLCIYKEIEKIENEVIIHANYKSDLDPIIDKANRELRIIGNNSLINVPDEFTLKLDNIMLHKIWGIFIFLAIMATTFSAIFWAAAPVMDLVDTGFQNLSQLVTDNLGHYWYTDLISNGIIGGTGAVMIFLPQILILFIILGILEDTGYLARGAMLIDKPLSKLGLNGRSFVPMLSGFACAIPAIMAARTIQNRKERYLTIFIIPLMSCSARLPVYGLLLAFLLPGKYFMAGLILALIYVFGIFTSLIVASVLNKYSKPFIKVEDNSSFIMELPVYRMPKFGNVFKNTYANSFEYLKKAGPTILIFSIAIWFLTYFPNSNPQINTTTNMSEEHISKMIESERVTKSYAAQIGKIIEPIMKPIGLDWRVGVSLIATFAAREVFVSSLALIFKVADDDKNLRESLVMEMRTAKFLNSDKLVFTTSTIIGLIVFFIFALQCISTIAISKKETGGWRIPILQIIVYTGSAYLLSLIVVNGLRFIGIA